MNLENALFQNLNLITLPITGTHKCSVGSEDERGNT